MIVTPFPVWDGRIAAVPNRALIASFHHNGPVTY
jgi:hypothetical protein